MMFREIFQKGGPQRHALERGFVPKSLCREMVKFARHQMRESFSFHWHPDYCQGAGYSSYMMKPDDDAHAVLVHDPAAAELCLRALRDDDAEAEREQAESAVWAAQLNILTNFTDEQLHDAAKTTSTGSAAHAAQYVRRWYKGRPVSDKLLGAADVKTLKSSSIQLEDSQHRAERHLAVASMSVPARCTGEFMNLMSWAQQEVARAIARTCRSVYKIEIVTEQEMVDRALPELQALRAKKLLRDVSNEEMTNTAGRWARTARVWLLETLARGTNCSSSFLLLETLKSAIARAAHDPEYLISVRELIEAAANSVFYQDHVGTRMLRDEFATSSCCRRLLLDIVCEIVRTGKSNGCEWWSSFAADTWCTAVARECCKSVSLRGGPSLGDAFEFAITIQECLSCTWGEGDNKEHSVYRAAWEEVCKRVDDMKRDLNAINRDTTRPSKRPKWALERLDNGEAAKTDMRKRATAAAEEGRLLGLRAYDCLFSP